MRKVLCVWLGNASRSPMMQAVLQGLLGAEFEVESAGVLEAAGGTANPLSVACLQARGVDLAGHGRRWIGDLDLQACPHIVCVDEPEAEQLRARLRHAGPIVLVANADAGGIPDPCGTGLAGYQACLALLDDVMPGIAARVR